MIWLNCHINQTIAQRPRFQPTQNLGFQPNPIGQPVTFQQPTFVNPPPVFTTPPPAVLQAPTLLQGQAPSNPFNLNSQPFPFNSNQQLLGPSGPPPNLGFQPIQVLPPQFGQPPAGNYSQFGQPFFNGNQANQSGWPATQNAWPSQFWDRMRNEYIPRLIERPRFRHTYLPGSTGNELEINATEIATTMTFPNFLGTQQPIRISPGFVFDFWNGPEASTGFELPSKAYTIYISGNYISNPQNRFGTDLNFTAGMYTDFDNVSSDSLRLTGTFLGWSKINSYTTAKFGAAYFDRLDVKVLPAFGVFIAPNPDLRFDIFFPRPKLAQRLPSRWNLDLWVYTGGEYGGGQWAIERPIVGDDEVDISDVRAFIGIEWIGQRQNTGFIEVGYVFNRKLMFRSERPNFLDLKDTIMLRTGVAF